jgi:hypothetical protein
MNLPFMKIRFQLFPSYRSEQRDSQFVPATRLEQQQSPALMSKSQFALRNRVTFTQPFRRSIST